MVWQKSSAALMELFAKSLPDDARVERRQMFGYPAAFVQSKMFAGLHEERYLLRVSEALCEQLIAQHGALRWEPWPGRRMREYVVLPQSMLRDRALLALWLQRAMDYAVSLPPKVAKKSKRDGVARAADVSAKKPSIKKPLAKKREATAAGVAKKTSSLRLSKAKRK